MSSALIAMMSILILLTLIAVVLVVSNYFFHCKFKRIFKIIIVVSILIVSIGSVGLLVIMRGIHNGANEDNTVINMRSAYYLLASSAACGVIGLCVLTNLIKLNQRYKIGALTGIAFLVVLFLQMSVVIGYPYADEVLSSKDHQIAHTLLYTLQYFSLDAGYANIVDIGQKVFGGTGIIHIFHIIAGSMTVLAPLVGGFAIFDILGRFFPKIRLFFNRKAVKYVFSELNQYSIETAESIYRLREQLLSDKKKCAEFKQKHGYAEYCEIVDSVIIFTDVYTDKGSENSSELLKRAKDIDAICLKDDVLNLKIRWVLANFKYLLNKLIRSRKNIHRKTVYFLVDGNDFDVKQGVENNLQTAVSLYGTRSDKTVWTKTKWFQFWTKAQNMEMYVFTRNEKADKIIGAARAEWENNYMVGENKTPIELKGFYENTKEKLEDIKEKITIEKFDEMNKNVKNFIKLYNSYPKKEENEQNCDKTVCDYADEIIKIVKCESNKAEANICGRADEKLSSVEKKEISEAEQVQSKGDKQESVESDREDKKKEVSEPETVRMLRLAELCEALVKAVNAQNGKGQAVDVDFGAEIKQIERLHKEIKRLVDNVFKRIKAVRKARIITSNSYANDEFKEHIRKFDEEKIKNYLRDKARNNTNIFEAVKCVNDELHNTVNPNINVWNKKRVSSVFKCINEYRNLVYNLIDGDREKDECNAQSVPLYTALQTEQGCDTSKLNVLIVGSGRIAKEFLKATYWCGQMLDCNGDPTKLRIGVLSLDAMSSKEQLKFDMPEVFVSERCNYNAKRNSYCEFEFLQTEFGTKEFKSVFDKCLSGKIWKTLDAPGVNAVAVDYVLVALGSDEVNMRAAEWISREISLKNVNNRIPVNYIIENDELCDSLRDRKKCNADKGGVLLNPFGSLRDRFEYGNIRMSDAERRALIANCAYGNDGGKEGFLLDTYSRESSIAVAIHNSYKQMCIREGVSDQCVGWLEHRRWNAYMRSEGYRGHTAREFNDFALERDTAGAITKLAHKNVDLKLHACLVESEKTSLTKEEIKEALQKVDVGYIRTSVNQHINEKGISKILTDLRNKAAKGKDFDDLDMLSIIKNVFRAENTKNFTNFKNNDISIYKNLKKDAHDKKIAEYMDHVYRVGAINKFESDFRRETDEVRKIFADCEFFDEQEDNGVCTNKCIYNPNVIKIENEKEKREDIFIWLCEWRGYDIVAVYTKGGIDNDKNIVKKIKMKKPFVITIKPNDQAQFSVNGNGGFMGNTLLLGIPRGSNFDLKLEFGKQSAKYYIAVGECEGYQKILGIYLNGCLVGKKQKPWRIS